MKNNPSEQKRRHYKSLFHGVRFKSAILSLAILTSAASCSNDNSPNPGCRTPEQALADYSSFLNSISSMNDVPTSELIESVKRWRATDDSVANSINIANQISENDSLPQRYFQIRDSIGGILIRMVDSRTRSFSDYLQCVRSLNYTRLDSVTLGMVKSVRKFYDNVDRLPVFNSTNRETIQYYEYLLDTTLKNGFKTPKDLFKFLEEEDRTFRTFLCHLTTMGEIPLTAVRDSTKRVLSDIITLSYDENFPFNAKETLVILTMRNNRRLIQNASQCVTDIENKKISAGDQSTAYLWMLLQPWVSFDSFAFALLDENQFEAMEDIAGNLPAIFERLKGAEFPVKPSLLPNILIKTWISQL